MKFRLDIDCDNAAFGDGLEECAAELARILAGASRAVVSPSFDINEEIPIIDINGNRVGSFSLYSE